MGPAFSTVLFCAVAILSLSCTPSGRFAQDGDEVPSVARSCDGDGGVVCDGGLRHTLSLLYGMDSLRCYNALLGLDGRLV